MRISFDLDDTLICYADSVPREPTRVPFFLRWWLNEPLRLGTRELIQQLRQRKCEIWIYTSSSRTRRLIRLWLRCYGIAIDGVINQQVYAEYLRRNPVTIPASKNPRSFGIDLHIDDLPGVFVEGEQHGFDVLVVSPENELWVQDVLAKVDAVRDAPLSPLAKSA
ncbi:MAG: hypothetical protein ACI92S_003735 [Planctomycetaceae bacterium]